MFRHLKIGLFSASALALTAGTALADFELNILHINDLHSRIEAIGKTDSTCSEKDAAANECFGGIARVKSAIDARRAELSDKNVLTLDAGDQFQAMLFYTTYKNRRNTPEKLELMKYDPIVRQRVPFKEAKIK